MADWTGRSPGNTFGGIVNVDNSNNGIDGTLRPIQDGKGTEGPFQLSTTGLRLKAASTLDGLSGATLDMTNLTVTRPKGFSLLATNSPTSGTSFQMTGLPATANVVLIVFTDLSYSSADRTVVQLLDAGTPETTGYFTTSVFFNNSTTVSVGVRTTAFELMRQNNTNGTNTHSGTALLVKNGSTGKWQIEAAGRLSYSGAPTSYGWSVTVGESPAVTGTMSGLEFETSGGSTFSAGTVTVYYSEQG